MRWLMMDTCCWLNLPFMKGCDSILNRLDGLLLLDEMRLLVPRVIIEEFERHKNDIATRKVRSMRTHVKEVRLIGRELLEGQDQESLKILTQRLDARFDELGADSIKVIGRIDGLLVHHSTVAIEMTNDHLARAAKRGYDKRAPFIKHKNSVADGVIIEMFGDRVQRRDAQDVLYFVTENTSDFSDPLNDNTPHAHFSAIFNDGDHVKFSINVAETLNEIAASALPAKDAEEEAIPEDVIQEVDEFVKHLQPGICPSCGARALVEGGWRGYTWHKRCANCGRMFDTGEPIDD